MSQESGTRAAVIIAIATAAFVLVSLWCTREVNEENRERTPANKELRDE